MRYAIINRATGAVENVVEYETAPGDPLPGFGAGYLAIADDRAGPGWQYANGALIAPPDPNPPPSADYIAEQERQRAIRADAGRMDLQTRLRAATPGQIETYVANNVTDLASAKILLARILKLIAIDLR